MKHVIRLFSDTEEERHQERAQTAKRLAKTGNKGSRFKAAFYGRGREQAEFIFYRNLVYRRLDEGESITPVSE
jgi:hypothetical protein